MRSLLAVAFCVLAVATVASAQSTDPCNGNDYGTAGQFDFYVFAQSWPAEFCSAHTEWPGCSNPTQWQQTNLTLHGMWPNYATPQGSHDWPQCCSSTFGSTIDPTVVQDLLTQLQQYWPNEQDPSGSNLGTSLWNHEWGKHGTCSGLAQENYMQQAMALEIGMPTPNVIVSNIGGQANFTDLMAAYNGADCQEGEDCIVGLNCDQSDNGQALSGITTCWSPEFAQITCPSAVFSDMCNSDSLISIVSFAQAQAKVAKRLAQKKIQLV